DQLAIVGVRGRQHFKRAQASLQSRLSQKLEHLSRPMRVAGTYVSQHFVLASTEKPAMLLGHIAVEDLALTLGTEEGRVNQDDSAKLIADPARDHPGRHASHRMPEENRGGESELADEPYDVTRVVVISISISWCARVTMTPGIGHHDVEFRLKTTGQGRPAGAIAAESVEQHQWRPASAGSLIVNAGAACLTESRRPVRHGDRSSRFGRRNDDASSGRVEGRDR